MNIQEVLACSDERHAVAVYRRLLAVYGKDCADDIIDGFKLGIVFNRETERKGKIRLPVGYNLGGKKKNVNYSEKEKAGISRFFKEGGYALSGNDGEWVPAAKFHAKYVEFCLYEMQMPTSIVKFGNVLGKNGYEKKRTQTGWKYLIFKKVVVETEKSDVETEKIAEQ